MEFNPSKCEHLMVTNKHSFIQSSYKLCGHTIKKVSYAKYLGIMLDQKLMWKEHINSVCSKAKAFLQRNLTHYPKHVKSNIIVIKPCLDQY